MHAYCEINATFNKKKKDFKKAAFIECKAESELQRPTVNFLFHYLFFYFVQLFIIYFSMPLVSKINTSAV